MNEEISFEILNAYVDGELDAARAADVALAVAGDAALARQVAVLSRLHSVMIEAAEIPDIIFNPPPERRSLRPLFAACVAFLVFTAGALAVAGIYQQPPLPQWYVAVSDAHSDWPRENSTAAIRPAGFSGSGVFRGAFIPRLDAAKLTISSIDESAGPTGAEQITVRYRGTRGCRITLFISAEALAFPLEKKLFKQGRRRAYAWRNGKYGYGVIAEGMDVSRYRLIVETMYGAIRRYQPIGSEAQIALGESRRRSAPCQA